MKTIPLTAAVLTLLVGLSSCSLSLRDDRGEWRQHRDDRGYRGDQGDRGNRDCWTRGGRVYCRDGN